MELRRGDYHFSRRSGRQVRRSRTYRRKRPLTRPTIGYEAALLLLVKSEREQRHASGGCLGDVAELSICVRVGWNDGTRLADR